MPELILSVSGQAQLAITADSATPSQACALNNVHATATYQGQLVFKTNRIMNADLSTTSFHASQQAVISFTGSGTSKSLTIGTVFAALQSSVSLNANIGSASSCTARDQSSIYPGTGPVDCTTASGSEAQIATQPSSLSPASPSTASGPLCCKDNELSCVAPVGVVTQSTASPAPSLPPSPPRGLLAPFPPISPDISQSLCHPKCGENEFCSNRYITNAGTCEARCYAMTGANNLKYGTCATTLIQESGQTIPLCLSNAAPTSLPAIYETAVTGVEATVAKYRGAVAWTCKWSANSNYITATSSSKFCRGYHEVTSVQFNQVCNGEPNGDPSIQEPPPSPPITFGFPPAPPSTPGHNENCHFTVSPNLHNCAPHVDVSGCGSDRDGVYALNCANVGKYACSQGTSQCAISVAGTAFAASFQCVGGTQYASTGTCLSTTITTTTAPCFGYSSATACRLADPSVSPANAYDACYLGGGGVIASRVLMSDLLAGDYVLSTSEKSSRVIFNQHAGVNIHSPLIRIQTVNGVVLELTPDHVLLVNGKWQPASKAVIGSVLSSDEGEVAVTSHSLTHGRVINPVLASGQILASGLDGPAVRATVARDGLEAFFEAGRVERSVFNLLTAAWPNEAQIFWDVWLEDLSMKNTNHLILLSQSWPSFFFPILFLVSDLSLSFGFVFHCCLTRAYTISSLAGLVIISSLLSGFVGACVLLKKRRGPSHMTHARLVAQY